MAKTFNSRRNFLKSSSLASIPFIMPVNLPAAEVLKDKAKQEAINFFTDSAMTTAQEYAKALQVIAEKSPEVQDTYGKGGAVARLEQQFAEVTGKEKAIFMPSGTMANNLALKVLSEGNTKIFVQETSHLYRDEADAAQAVHSKRLIPLATGKAAFTLEELKEAIAYHDKGEVYKSGIGAVSIENPVRRADGAVVSLEEIRKIAAYCRENDIKLHLDGARLHMASTYAGVPVKEYASYFDTVYISLYKYLGSKAGAILCGDAKVIDRMPQLIKIYGGNMYQNWPYAAMALEKLPHIDTLLQQASLKGKELISQLNQLQGITISAVPQGTNVFNLQLDNNLQPEKLLSHLKDKSLILLRTPDPQGIIKFYINETVLKRSNESIVAAFKNAVAASRA